MADVILTHSTLARIGIDKVFPIYSQERRRRYREIGWSDEKTTQEFIKMRQEGGFGYAPVVNEATPIPSDTFAFTNEKDYYWIKRGLQYRQSFEKIETDQYGVVKRVAKKMAKAMEDTKESTAANIFNNHTSTGAAYVGPDGAALISASHPYDGGNDSNLGVTTSDTNVDLSVVTLEQAIEKSMNVLNHRGIPDPVQGPFRLLVPNASWGLANRLARSVKLPQSNDNDPNVGGEMITSVIVNPWLTDTDAWWLVSDNSDEHGLFMLKGGKRRVQKKIFEETEEVAFLLTEKWLFHHMDWRGVWGTSGI